MKTRYLIATALLILTAGCHKETTPKATVSPSHSELGYQGGEVVLSLESNVPWSSSCEVEGVTLSPSSGTGDARITLRIPENDRPETRSVRILFTAQEEGASSRSTTRHVVTLESAPYIGFPAGGASISPNGGGIRAELWATRPWHLSGELPGWISLDGTEGASNAVLSLTLPANETGAVRECDVLFALRDYPGKTASFHIIQPSL